MLSILTDIENGESEKASCEEVVVPELWERPLKPGTLPAVWHVDVVVEHLIS